MKKGKYGAVVVGTGFGGSVASCRLAQAGIDVAILERGRRYPKGAFPRDWRDPLNGWLWEHGQGLFDVRAVSQMFIVQSAGYGGGSLIYANVHLRAPADLFQSGWPDEYKRELLDPYYDLVAYMLDIRPIAGDQPLGLPPRSAMLDAMAASLGRKAQYRALNLAVNFGAPEQARPNKFGVDQEGCRHCGECDIGCNYQAKNTLDLNYLAVAERNGAEVATQAEVFKIAPNGAGYRVHFRDHAAGGTESTVDADAVFLCAGAVNTTELLLRCRDQYRTLPNLTGALGQRYSGNGDFLAFVFDTTKSYRPDRGPTITTGIVYDRGTGDDRTWFIFEDGGYPRQIANLLQAINPSRSLLPERQLLQAELRQEIRRLGGSLLGTEPAQGVGDDTAVFLAMGRDRADGRMTLVPESNCLHIDWNVPANMPLYGVESRICSDIASAFGGQLALTPNWKLLHQPVSVHNLGGAVLANRPEDGVLDRNGQVFGYPNLYVLDGAALPVATGVNPSHTIAAVAERNVERAIRTILKKDWVAPERASAVRIVDPLDDLVTPAGGTALPETPEIDIEFTETMRGFCAQGEVDFAVGESQGKGAGRRIEFTLTITLPDIDRFLADKGHAGIARGTVRVDGLTSAAGAPVTSGVFNLFVATDSARRRRMLYQLPFFGDDGQPYLLDGFKDVRDDGTFDVWAATSTLYTVVRQGHTVDGPIVATGILHILKLDFAHQLTTIRVHGAPNILAEADALRRFGDMFVGTLWDVFVRSKFLTS